MAKDINNEVYSEETKLKLTIFRDCFKEWFPVFLNNRYISKIFIYDLFAGSGKDIEGNYGSPLILLQEAKGLDGKYCKQVNKNNKPKIYFGFDEKEKAKIELLKQNVYQELSSCKDTCTLPNCIISENCFFDNKDFQELIHENNVTAILKNNDFGKFILLDQYGFKQITNEVFLKLVNSPKTDFIFFIATSFIRRFKDEPSVNAYFKKENIEFDLNKPKECHREITKYFKSLVPRDKDYYIHSFTIQKGSNYYGLIFGSNHSFGMEKFLNVCWKEDPLAGESNCNIDNDFEEGTLFFTPNNSNKIQKTKKIIREKVLDGTIKDNQYGLAFALKSGCKPKLFIDVIDELLYAKKIEIIGKYNRTASSIHSAKKYEINVL